MSAFTVVIPAYNAADDIKKTLDSVARQTFTLFDIVVIDDGSTDGTGQVVSEWASGYSDIRVTVYRQPNLGPAAARNRGIEVASSPYIAFLDSDDRWSNRKLEQVHAVLSNSKEIDVLAHDVKVIHKDGTSTYEEAGPHGDYRDLLLQGNCLYTSGTIVRTESLRKAGGFREDPRLTSVEDYDLWLRLAYSGAEFRFVNEALTEYDVRKGGISHQPVLHCRSTLHLIDLHACNLEPTLIERHYLRRRRADAFHRAGAVLLRKGAMGKGMGYLVRAAARAPYSPANIAGIVRDLIRLPLFGNKV